MMYCKKCGKEITGDSVYCKYCGTRQVPQYHLYNFYNSYGKLKYSIQQIIKSVWSIIKKIVSWILPLLIRGIVLTLLCSLLYLIVREMTDTGVAIIGTSVAGTLSSLYLIFYLIMHIKYKYPMPKWVGKISSIFSIISIIVTCIAIGRSGYSEYQNRIAKEKEILQDSLKLKASFENLDILFKKGLGNSTKANALIDNIIHYTSYNFEKANVYITYAKRGNAYAARELGYYYKPKEGLKGKFYSEDENVEKSTYWYLQAAKLGDAYSQGITGQNYKYGIGVSQNFEKALYWIKLGAKHGNDVAQYILGDLYLNGLAYYTIHGTSRCWYDGGRIFRSLSEEETVTEQYLQEYLNSPDTVYLKPDLTKAKYYWMLSAKQGNQDAQNALEKVYE